MSKKGLVFKLMGASVIDAEMDVCVFMFVCLLTISILVVITKSSYYEENNVRFHICRNLKMTLYSQMNFISHLQAIGG